MLYFYSFRRILIPLQKKEWYILFTNEIIDLDSNYYMNTFGKRIPVVFEYGRGSTLYDKEGRAYTDFLAGIAVNSLGHAHPALVEAISLQAGRLIHCSSLFYIESQAKLAEALVKKSCFDRVFFGNSGAEAVEGAIKLARNYFYKKGMYKYEILTNTNSFHGRTLAALSATGQPKYQKPYEPLPKGFKHIPYNDLKAAYEAVSDTTCAIMIELIQGEGGIIEASAEYVEGIAKLCREKGLLLIFDEIQTGIGRTGKMFAYEHFGVEPDILTLAKGLGGGVPIGALLAKSHAAAFEPGDHGSTFGGNPLACTAALAVLKTLSEEDLIEQSAIKGAYFKDKLIYLKSLFPFINDVRGKGLMLGLELDETVNGKTIVEECLKAGFIINCAGKNTLRFVPPLIITKNEIDSLIEALESIFSQLKEATQCRI